MQSDELFIDLDLVTRPLKGPAVKLLLRLLSIGAQIGESQITASDRQIQAELNISRDTLAVARRQLAGVMQIECASRTVTTYTLPERWLTLQRSLFAHQETVTHLVDKPGQHIKKPLYIWPGNQARSGRQTRPDLVDKPGQMEQSGRQTRPDLVDKPGQMSQSGRQTRPDLVDKPGQMSQSGRQTRPDIEVANKERARAQIDQIRSDRSIDRENVAFVDQVLKTAGYDQARLDEACLIQPLVFEYHCSGLGRFEERKPPSNKTLGQLLAIAPGERIAEELREMVNDGVPAGRKYIWFVIVLLERIHGIDHNFTVTRLNPAGFRKPPATAAGAAIAAAASAAAAGAGVH